jgi:PPR repeat
LPTELQSSLQALEELYYALRDIQISLGSQTLTADQVRTALMTIVSLPDASPAINLGFPRTMFLDLRAAWLSAWTMQDYTLIFDIFKHEGAFEQSLSLMKYLHEQPNLELYPDADCWALLFESLADHPYNQLKNVKEAWSLLLRSGTPLTTTAFNSLFGVLSAIPESFDFVIHIYNTQMLPSSSQPNHLTLISLLRIYTNQPPNVNHIEDGSIIFAKLLELKPEISNDDAYWDAILRWMLFRGDSIDSIKDTLREQIETLGDTAIQHLQRRDLPRMRTLAPHRLQSASATLEHLLALALRLGDIRTANSIYEELFPIVNISPSLETEELRLQTLLKMHNVVPAKSLYDNLRLQGQLISPGLVSDLIRALAEEKTPLPVEAQSVFFDLLDMKDSPSELLSSSFATVTNLLLRVEDYPRLRQTLQDRHIERIPNWRHILSTTSLEILSNPKTIWLEHLLPVYHIVQHWAPGMITLSHRHDMMRKLMFHGRTDLGLELFHDMRHSDISQPTRDTYAMLLSGCATTRDPRTLVQVHNALRLDSNVEPDSNLFNGLMLAYNRCRLPDKALAIWEVLSQSSRLPDPVTASLALAACVHLPQYGLIRAREIWAYMETNNINRTSASYAALLSVFASVGKWDAMMGLLERMDVENVDALVLGTAYNAMRRDRKPDIELWAKQHKPDIWEFLENVA